MIRRGLAIVIAGGVVVLLCRTFLILGVATPLEVEGSSMAPALLGPHAQIACPRCGNTIQLGSDQLPDRDPIDCPWCQVERLSLDDANWFAGDRLLLDRRISGAKQPRRWEVVVLRRPDNARTLCVKRVLGLPGETIQLAGGDLLVNGQPARKTLLQQRQLRVLVHQETSRHLRWLSDQSAWKREADAWQLAEATENRAAMLLYQSPGGEPVRDDLPLNGRVSRQLNVVGDLMLTAEVKLAGESIIALQIERGQQLATAFVDARAGEVQLAIKSPTENRVERAGIDAGALSSPFEATLSLFDRQALVAIGDEVVVKIPLSSSRSAGEQRISIAGFNGPIRLSNLRLWRDVYYEQRRRDLPLTPPAACGLAADEWFVVGDNQAISHDSRNWSPAAGVPSRLLVGRLLAP